MQSGETWMELQALRKHGWSIRALAREFGLSRNTVRRELRSAGPRQYSSRARPTALNAAQLAHVERRLAVCPGIRGSLLYFELRRDYQYEASYPAFVRHLRTLRPPVMRDPEIRFETDPGIQTQADWAHLGGWPLGDSMVELHAMVTILVANLEHNHERGSLLHRQRGYIIGPPLLIIDELGYLPMDQAAANWIFHVVTKRYQRGSIILTSNRGFGDWGQIFNEPVVAAAIVDRLLHNATVLNIRGHSYRMRGYHADLRDDRLSGDLMAAKGHL